MRLAFLLSSLLLASSVSAESDTPAQGNQPTAAEPAAPAIETYPLIPVPFEEARGPQAAIERAESTLLDPVTVTATKTAHRTLDVPASVSVIDQLQIEDSGASTLGAVVNDLPGVTVEGGPRSDAEFINIRGLSGPRVLLIVDGTRQDFYGGHRSSLMVEPELIKQVEVLRGPASALWGSDAVGGVVAATTRDASDFVDPDEHFAARLKAGYDSAVQAKFGSTLGAARLGNVDAIGDISWRDSSDFRIGGGGTVPNSARKTLGSLVKLSWLPEGPHRFGLNYQGFRDHGLSPSNPATDVDDENPLLDRTNDQRYVVAHYGINPPAMGNWLQAAEINVYRNDLDIREDRVDQPRLDRTAFNTTGGNGHATLPLWGEASLTAGGELYEDGARATRDGAPRPQFPDSKRTVGGGFVQAELPFGVFSFIPGLRYDRYAAESNTDAAAPIRESALSPKVGVVWRVSDGLRLRASYGQGFRAPSLIELYSSGQHFLGNDFVPNPDLKPERARNLEAGFSWEMADFAADQKLMLGASVYRNGIRDFIELVVAADVQLIAPQCLPPAPAVGCVNRNDDGSANPAAPPLFVDGTTTTGNLTNATLTGGEMEAAYSIGPVKLSADYGRVRGINKDNGQPLATIPADTIHAALTWSASHALRPQLSFTHAFEQDQVPTSSADQITVSPSTPLDPVLLSRFSSAGTALPQPTPGYSVWSASLVWAPLCELWGLREPRVILAVDNIRDTRYREHLNSIASPGRSLRVSLSSAF